MILKFCLTEKRQGLRREAKIEGETEREGGRERGRERKREREREREGGQLLYNFTSLPSCNIIGAV